MATTPGPPRPPPRERPAPRSGREPAGGRPGRGPARHLGGGGPVPGRLGARQPARPGDLLQPLARRLLPRVRGVHGGPGPPRRPAPAWPSTPPWSRPATASGWSGWPCSWPAGCRRRLAHHLRGRDRRGRAPQPLPPAAAERRAADGDQPGPLPPGLARPARPLPGPGPVARPVGDRPDHTVLLFFFQYLSAFVSRFPSTRPPTARGLLTTIVGVAAVLVTNLIVVAPVLLLARRWRHALGTVALLTTAGAVGLTSLREFALGALVRPCWPAAWPPTCCWPSLRPGPTGPAPSGPPAPWSRCCCGAPGWPSTPSPAASPGRPSCGPGSSAWPPSPASASVCWSSRRPCRAGAWKSISKA